jgi:hypothetical protein
MLNNGFADFCLWEILEMPGADETDASPRIFRGAPPVSSCVSALATAKMLLDKQ